MNEILDDQIDELNKTKKNDTIGFVFSVIMLIGGVFFFKFTSTSGSNASITQLLVVSFLFQSTCILIPLLISLTYLLLTGNYRKELITKMFLINKVQIGFIIWCSIIAIIYLNEILF